MLQQMIASIPMLLSPDTLLFLLRAAGTTLLLTAIGCGIGFAAGALIAILRQTTGLPLLPLRVLATLYVEIFRRVPFLVTLFLVLFTTQALLPGLSTFTVATIAISIMSTAYLAEIVRAGLESVPRTQFEAAMAMNFGFWRAMRMVVIPQAWKVILPPAVAYAVMFVKDTALASQIGVFEIVFAGKTLINRGQDAFLVYFAITVLYVAISYPLALLGRRLEARLARRARLPSVPGVPLS